MHMYIPLLHVSICKSELTFEVVANILLHVLTEYITSSAFLIYEWIRVFISFNLLSCVFVFDVFLVIPVCLCKLTTALSIARNLICC
jgi:hypothetical protein